MIDLLLLSGTYDCLAESTNTTCTDGNLWGEKQSYFRTQLTILIVNFLATQIARRGGRAKLHPEDFESDAASLF